MSEFPLYPNAPKIVGIDADELRDLRSRLAAYAQECAGLRDELEARSRLASHDACLTQVREEMPEVALVRKHFERDGYGKFGSTRDSVQWLLSAIDKLQSKEGANRNAIKLHLETIAARELANEHLREGMANLATKLVDAEARERGLREALEWYANPGNWTSLDDGSEDEQQLVVFGLDHGWLRAHNAIVAAYAQPAAVEPVAAGNTSALYFSATGLPAAVQIDPDDRDALKLCSDCPPAGYPTDATRCRTCPLRAKPAAVEQEKYAGLPGVVAQACREYDAAVEQQGENNGTV